jgi:RNA polymerase II subunit A-like phosphatase
VPFRTSLGKHDREEGDDEEGDEESNLAKKKKLANSRSTGLKSVKTSGSIGSESSLPTPSGTGGEDDEVDQLVAVEEEEDDDLEAAMMAEFEKDEWENEDPEGDSGPPKSSQEDA